MPQLWRAGQRGIFEFRGGERVPIPSCVRHIKSRTTPPEFKFDLFVLAPALLVGPECCSSSSACSERFQGRSACSVAIESNGVIITAALRSSSVESPMLIAIF